MPQGDLRCAFIQHDPVWQQPEVNRAHLAELICEQGQDLDLLVLPEMFTAGFSMDVISTAEEPDGPTLQWMADQSASSGAVITGSYAVRVGDKAFNRLVWMKPDGQYQVYDKRHLFRMGGEHDRYDAGDRRVLVEVKGWRVLPLICYDLRFPVWCRNRGDYDLSLFVANWPAARSYHWTALLRARAIENQAPVIGVNRVGRDGNDWEYSGDSVMIDAKGQSIVEAGADTGLFRAQLSAEELERYREKFPVHLDADQFDIVG